MKKVNYKNNAARSLLNPCKLLLWVLLMSAFINQARAVVANYTFASSSGTYTSITGTTLFSGAWDDSDSPLLTIPFTFTYNGISYTTLGVNSNGFITLGATTSTVYCGLQSSDVNSIAGYGTDLVGNTGSTVEYTTSGTTPNRQFIIEWADCKHYNATGDHYSFQIILNENGSTVQVKWGTVTAVTTMGANACADAATESGNVGLLGAANTDFNIRSISNGNNSWATSVNGGALTSVCNMSSTNFPASGLTYTWTPPVPTPMVFNSSTTVFLNNGGVDGQGSAHEIIQVQVVTTGNLTPFNVSSLTLSTAGCTNALADITNAKVYFTGLNNSISFTTQFGSTVNSPNGTYTVNGTATLGEGVNYFWVSYTIASNATIGHTLSACCNSITGSGTMGVRTPSVTCPSGTHTVGAPLGFWTPLANTSPTASGGLMLLLSDGTVMAKSSAGGASSGNLWNKLTPDASGSYINGTWTALAPMIDTRLYFSTQVLKDGRVYAAGGEYGTGLANAETYNPLTNTWTAAPQPGQNVSDANSEILEDGRVLQALVAGNLKGTVIYNPVTNTYSAGPSTIGIHNESAWIKLPDNSILMVDRLSTNSERYIPATNTWVADGTVPVALYDPFGDETGGSLLLPDGRAFFIGSLGHTAYYTPSGSSSPGTWAAGPDIPGGQGVPDGPAAMMTNGHILMSVSPIPTSADHFPPPTAFYEFDYVSNTYSLINTPYGGTSTNISCFVTNFLALPDGNVLYAKQGSSQYYAYTPGTGPLFAGKPTINTISQTSCTQFNITGTQFNGISQGASYGDDWQMATNYPIIRLTSGANVYYCRTFNWNSTGVQRGSSVDNVDFTLPAGLPAGTYSLVVTANGIASDPLTFNAAPTLSSTLTPTAICSGNTFAYTPASSRSNATYTWTRAAVSGISNSAITTPQTSNPNEVLTNTTVNPIPVVYVYTITGGSCSNSQNVTVVVNPSPTVSSTVSPSTTVCVGTSVILSGTGASTYTWTGGLTNGNSFIPGGTTTYTVTGTSANGCSNTATRTITVNQNTNINTQPSAQTICESGNTSFTVGATGTSLTYQWQFTTNGTVWNNVPNSPPYFNITSATLNIIGATTTMNTFNYRCLVSGTCGSPTSIPAQLNVNPIVTAGLTISGASSICSGATINLTATPTNGGTPTYQWKLNGNNVGTNSATYSSSTLATGNIVTCVMTSNAACVIGSPATSNAITVTVNPLPTVGVTVSPSATICAGASVTMNGTGATTYSWSGGYVNNLSFIPVGTGTYTVTGTTNGCSATATQTITLNPNPTVGVNTTSSSVCTGTSVTMNGTGASTYLWTGGISDGVAFTPTATTTYTVTGTTNGCSNTATQTITVNPFLTVVATATATSVCAGTPVILSGTGATSYGWSGGVTNGIAFTPTATTTYTVTGTGGAGCSGTAVITITVNPIPTPVITPSGPTNFCTGGNVVLSASSGGSYLWSNGATTQNITVTATGNYSVTVNNNGCVGTSAIITTNKSTAIPATPLSMTGATNVCAFAGFTTNVTYSTPVVAGVLSWNWTIPANSTLVSGQGTNTILLNYSSSFVSGNVTVSASNGCGTSAVFTKVVSKNIPAMPSTLTGPTAICSYVGTLSQAVYSTTAVTGAASYLWTVPTGATIVSGQGTISINVNYGTSTVSGNVTVKSVANCGSSTAKTLAVARTIPAIPGTITGPVNACRFVNTGTQAIYSIAAVSGAASYLWTVPTGTTIVSGQGTTSLTVTFGSTFAAGNVTVKSVANCGTSAAKTLAVARTANAPVSITGTTYVCDRTPTDTLTYSTAAVTYALSYNWTVPAGVTIISGQGTTAIKVQIQSSFSTGAITVMAVWACGNSTATSLTLQRAPGITTAITGPTNICTNQTPEYKAALVAGATGYSWKMSGGITPQAGTSGTITYNATTFVTTVTGSYDSITVNVDTSIVRTATSYIKVAAMNNCATTTYFQKNLTACRSLMFGNTEENELDSETAFSLYPNPNSGEFTIQISSEVYSAINKQQATIELYDVLGNILLKTTIKEQTSTINIDNYKNGMYLLRVIDNDLKTIYTERIIKD